MKITTLHEVVTKSLIFLQKKSLIYLYTQTHQKNKALN